MGTNKRSKQRGKRVARDQQPAVAGRVVPLGLQQQAAYPPPTIRVGNRVWKFGFNTLDAQCRLEELVRAYAEVEAMKRKKSIGGLLGEESFQIYEQRRDMGAYKTLNVGWTAIVAGVDGPRLFVMSLLQEYQPDVTEADVRELLERHYREVVGAVGQVAPDFFFAIISQMGVVEGVSQEQIREKANLIADSLAERFRKALPPEPVKTHTPMPEVSDPATLEPASG